MNRSTAVLSLFSLLFAMLAGCARERATPLIIGKTEIVQSKLLDLDVELKIFVPESYSSGEQKYPVLYIVQSDFLHASGIASWLSRVNSIPELIVVSLETYRSGDFTPLPIEGEPGTGGADKFIGFFKEELFPFIDARYPTKSYRIFYSGSWGGAFGVYAMLAQPDVFNACLTASPWIDYEGQSNFIEENASSLLKKAQFRNRFLYMAAENDQMLLPVLARFQKIMQSDAPPGLEWEYHPFADEDHSSIPHKTIYAGLTALFHPWRTAPPEATENGVKGLLEYKEVLSRKYGCDIGLSYTTLWSAGSKFLREKAYGRAREIFQLCVESYPDREFAYLKLAEAFEGSGQLAEAVDVYQKAHHLAARKKSPHVHVFKGELERVRKRVSEQ